MRGDLDGTGVLHGQEANWTKTFFSGHVRTGCWHCGAKCRENGGEMRADAAVCHCEGGGRGSIPCPARYCGMVCLQADWADRHSEICQPLREGMTKVVLENCERAVATDTCSIVACLMRVQASVEAIARNGNDCPADMIRLDPHMQVLRCLTALQTASERVSGVSDKTEICEHVRFLRDELVSHYLESVVNTVEEEGDTEVQWSKQGQRETLQLTLALKQLKFAERGALPFDPVPNLLDIASDIVLGQRSRALGKLQGLHESCDSLKVKGLLWTLTSKDAAAQNEHDIDLGSNLSDIAARLAHAIGASLALQVLRDAGRHMQEPDIPINLFDIFAWQPVSMPRAAAAVALPALHIAERWSRLAMCCDAQKQTSDHTHIFMRPSKLVSMARCGLYSARYALASFITSFDTFNFGRLVFGRLMVADLLYHAMCGLEKVSPSATSYTWVRHTFDGFISILQQIAKTINRRIPGKRWHFIYHKENGDHEVVYVDDEADPFWQNGQLAVVLCDSCALAFLEHEGLRSGDASRVIIDHFQLSRRFVDNRKLISFAGDANQVDADGRFFDLTPEEEAYIPKRTHRTQISAVPNLGNMDTEEIEPSDRMEMDELVQDKGSDGHEAVLLEGMD